MTPVDSPTEGPRGRQDKAEAARVMAAPLCQAGWTKPDDWKQKAEGHKGVLTTPRPDFQSKVLCLIRLVMKRSCDILDVRSCWMNQQIFDIYESEKVKMCCEKLKSEVG